MGHYIIIIIHANFILNLIEIIRLIINLLILIIYYQVMIFMFFI